MKGCDAYQIDSEKMLHGALGPEETALVDEHLKTCAACRHFSESARRVENMMQANAEQVAGTIDWEQIRGRVDELKSQARGAIPSERCLASEARRDSLHSSIASPFAWHTEFEAGFRAMTSQSIPKSRQRRWWPQPRTTKRSIFSVGRSTPSPRRAAPCWLSSPCKG